jgi:hypothetical protein
MSAKSMLSAGIIEPHASGQMRARIFAPTPAVLSGFTIGPYIVIFHDSEAAWQ